MPNIRENASKFVRRIFIFIGLSHLSLALSSCALFHEADLPNLLQPGQAQKIRLTVPFFAQDEHQCGPAATAMLLSYNGEKITPEQLTDEVYSANKKGSLQPSIISAIRRHHQVAYEVNDWTNLLLELNSGNPVLVLENLASDFWPVWHYALVIGYDSNSDEIILHSGTSKNEHVNARRFAFRWLRANVWGVIAVKPNEWPASATEESYLQAILGLEKVSAADALAAYQQAAKHWPANTKVWLGIGNTALTEKKYPVAIEAFTKASQLTPKLSGIWNNLALSYFYDGKKAEAIKAIDQALALSPENPAIIDSAQQIKSGN